MGTSAPSRQPIVEKEKHQFIEISLACANLRYPGSISHHSLYPFCKLYLNSSQSTQNKFNHVDSSQTLYGCVSGQFIKKFKFLYKFREIQIMRVCVFHQNFSNQAVEELIGSVEVKLSALSSCKNGGVRLKIYHPDDWQERGEIIVNTNLVHTEQDGEYLKITAQLQSGYNVGTYLKFMSMAQKVKGNFISKEIVRTEARVRKEEEWQSINIPLNSLFKNADKIFKIECWKRRQKKQKDQFLGDCFIFEENLNKIESQKLYFSLFNAKSQTIKGKIVIKSVDRVFRPSLLQYIRNGLKFEVSMSIDFTISNGNQRLYKSKHFLDKFKLNEYQTAMNATTSILLDYTSNSQIEVYGFGAKLHWKSMQTDAVSHCFPLTGDQNITKIKGFDQLMKYYRYALENIQFDGPTLFSPSLQKVIEQMKNTYKIEPNANIYKIHIILTDGDICESDIDKTMKLLKNNSYLPLSIIIIGIGKNEVDNYANMVKLDNDDNQLGIMDARDMINFVKFKDCQNNALLLAKQITKELPSQIQDYFGSMEHQPTINPKIKLSGNRGKCKPQTASTLPNSMKNSFVFDSATLQQLELIGEIKHRAPRHANNILLEEIKLDIKDEVIQENTQIEKKVIIMCQQAQSVQY